MADEEPRLWPYGKIAAIIAPSGGSLTWPRARSLTANRRPRRRERGIARR